MNSFGESLQPIHAGNQDVLHAALTQVVQHAQPEIRPFAFSSIKAQNILASVLVYPQNCIILWLQPFRLRGF